MAKDGLRVKPGGINLSVEERMVLEKVAKNGGLGWFSYVQRNYGNRRKKDAEHFYPFDRILDTKTNEYISVRDALRRIEAEVGKETVEGLDDHEKGVYAALYERADIVSKFLKVQYRGIFRNKGLFRRAVRWSAMDELADSFVSDEAKRLWDAEGYPKEVVVRHDFVNVSPMKWFRESDKDLLSEEEFDRISEVFKKCINM